MKTNRSVFVGLAAILWLPVSAIAWEEPETVLGVRWGASPDETTQILWKRAEEMDSRIGPVCYSAFRSCGMSLKIGPVSADATFIFREDKLVAVSLSFPAGSYSDLRRIFIERYGDPTRTTTEELRTRAGLSIKNEMLYWLGQRVRIQLQAYAGKITNGNAAILIKEEHDRRMEERARAIKKGKDDL